MVLTTPTERHLLDLGLGSFLSELAERDQEPETWSKLFRSAGLSKTIPDFTGDHFLIPFKNTPNKGDPIET